MQKMQQAAGGAGRGLGPNGMPTPAQIAAMQRSMPPGMLSQMRQSGAGLQDMMKAMMGPGSTDQDMAEMQGDASNPFRLRWALKADRFFS